MSNVKRVAAVCAAGAAPSLVPGFVLHGAMPFPWMLLFAAASAIGSGLIACALGAVALYAGRGRADHGYKAALGVALVAGLVMAGVAMYGIRAT